MGYRFYFPPPAAVMDALPSDFNTENITAAFAALSHSGRLQIIEALLQDLPEDGEPIPIEKEDPSRTRFKELQFDLDMGQSTLSYHLHHLEKAGLIERKTQGRSTNLRVRAERVRALAHLLREFAGPKE